MCALRGHGGDNDVVPVAPGARLDTGGADDRLHAGLPLDAKLSLGARQGVVRPMWFASPGTTCTYAYHPTVFNLAATVVNVPDPVTEFDPVQAGWPSQRIASSVGKGP